MARQHNARLVAGVMAAALVLSLGAAASSASTTKRSDAPITISFMNTAASKSAYTALITNFNHVYPNITINATFTPDNPTLQQLELTQLAAGSAPDILTVQPGCGNVLGICVLAKDGYIAPMIKVPWTRYSMAATTSVDKYSKGLFAYTPSVSPYGIFTNDDMFKKYGFTVPQTFNQLLALCGKASAAGVVPYEFPGTAPTFIQGLVESLVMPLVYAKDPHFTSEQRAGTVTFDGTPGWHTALQEFIDMNNAKCFEAGATGTSQAAAFTAFSQGQALMIQGTNGQKGTIDAANPQFKYSYHPWPNGTTATNSVAWINIGFSLAVNAHSSPAAQKAAQTFINFVARPKQDALFAQISGGMTQYQFIHQDLSDFMSPFKPVFADKKRFLINPFEFLWNSGVITALQTNGLGVITGQRSIDDVLNAMDTAFKVGPS